MKLKWEGKGKSGFVQEVKTGIPTDYIAYYKFDGDATDETGDYDLTATNITYVTDRFGNSSYASDYNTPTSQGLISSKYLVSAETFTISAWLNPRSISVIADIVNNEWFGGTGGFLAYLSTSNQLRLIVRNEDNSSNPGLTTTMTIPNNTWSHVVWIFGGDYIKIIKDNSTTESTTFTSIIPKINNVDTTIGMYSTHYYYGSIDDLRIYDRVLTTDEIGYLYNESNPI